jgi:seryl-tRNA synthetase
MPHFGPQDKQVIQEVMEWFPQRVGQELVPSSRNTTEGNEGNGNYDQEKMNRILEKRRRLYEKQKLATAALTEEHEMRSVRRKLQAHDQDIESLKKEQAKQQEAHDQDIQSLKKEQAEQREVAEANKQSLHSVHQVLQSLLGLKIRVQEFLARIPQDENENKTAGPQLSRTRQEQDKQDEFSRKSLDRTW